ISILAAKFVYPIILTLLVADSQVEFSELPRHLFRQMQPFVGYHLAVILLPLVIATLWLLPDFFGFLVWETKENWSLYRANRPASLPPVAVGSHGETVRRVLQPGFHSGTVPRLYARLRRAERQALRTGSWAAARACRQALEEVEK